MSGESWKKIQAQCTPTSPVKQKKVSKVQKVSGISRDIRMAMLLKKEEARKRDRLAMNRLQYNNYGTQNLFQYSPKFAALTSINPLSQDLRISEENSHDLTKVEHSDKPSIRCFVCSIELNPVTRCLVYDHFSVHFQDQLLENNGSRSECRFCSVKYSKPRRLAVHIGRGHSKVEQFIPQTARINPNSSLSAGIKAEVKTEVKKEPNEKRIVSMTKHKEKVCYICKKNVRYRKFNDMLDHYCNHLKVELSVFNSNTSSCDYCEKKFDPNAPPRAIYRHVGLSHKKILELIPEEAKLETNSTVSLDVGEISSIHPKLENETSESQISTPIGDLSSHEAASNSQSSTPTNNRFSHVSMNPLTIGTSKDGVYVENTTDGSVQTDEWKKQASCCICSRMIDCSTKTKYYIHFIQHFKEELLNIVTGLDCHLCSKFFSTQYQLLIHVGVTHMKLSDYML